MRCLRTVGVLAALGCLSALVAGRVRLYNRTGAVVGLMEESRIDTFELIQPGSAPP